MPSSAAKPAADSSIAAPTAAPRQPRKPAKKNTPAVANAAPASNGSRSREKKGKATAVAEKASVPVKNDQIAGDVVLEKAMEPTNAKALVPAKKHKKKKSAPKNTGQEVVAIEKKERKAQPPTWRLGRFVGGRYSHLDPVFSSDEKYIFLAHTNQVKIFSTKTSLLVRTLTLTSQRTPRFPNPIVDLHLDPRSENRLYIATTTRISLWDWTTGKEVERWYPDFGVIDRISTVPGAENEPPVVFVAGEPKGTSLRAVYRAQLLPESKVDMKEISRTPKGLSGMQVTSNGTMVVLMVNEQVWVMRHKETRWDVKKYTLPETLKCMDILPVREATEIKGKKKVGPSGGHVVVGDKKGALYILHDVLVPTEKRPKVEKKEGEKKAPVAQKAPMVPKKLHWHREAVASVKWALNGEYVVSGGSETVLVLWQLETGHKQFLPHLGANITNIVVSPRGTSYAIALSDNSVMNLSSTELKPTANIAGIQSLVQDRRNKNALRVPCILHPTIANNLLLATPSNQASTSASSPYMQTFDTASDRHIARQALARTNATTVNISPESTNISEPSITSLAITSDGQWLASVDEWSPPELSNAVPEDLTPAASQRREVYLKFWQWNGKRKEWDLIARVDSPHPSPDSAGDESILDLTALPASSGPGFVTIGTDGVARIWRPKDRARPGATTTGLINWSCRKTINFSSPRSALIQKPTFSAISWGALAISEDASVFAIASPDASGKDSTIRLIDPSSGITHLTLSGLALGGEGTQIALLDRYLIAAGPRKLLVWNLTTNAPAYEHILNDLVPNAIPTSVHLAIDPRAGTFALVASAADDTARVGGHVFVFDTTKSQPIWDGKLTAYVAALNPVGGGKGYMLLDAEARVQYLNPPNAMVESSEGAVGGGAAAIIGPEEIERRLEELYLGAGKKAAKKIVEEADVDMQDAETEGAVVQRQVLESVFDEVPTYAAGPVSEMFDKVFELFMAPARKGDDDEEEEEKQVVVASDGDVDME